MSTRLPANAYQSKGMRGPAAARIPGSFALRPVEERCLGHPAIAEVLQLGLYVSTL